MGEATYNNVYGNGTIGDITRAMKASGSTSGGKQPHAHHQSPLLLALQQKSKDPDLASHLEKASCIRLYNKTQHPQLLSLTHQMCGSAYLPVSLALLTCASTRCHPGRGAP